MKVKRQGTVVKITRHDRVEEWATRITTQLGKTVDAIIEIGRLLVKAKADLAHGEFGRLFDEHLVPFSPSTATRLMAIASHPVLSNRAHVHDLPPAWGTLYELTKVDQTTLKDALKQGRITPELTRGELEELMPRPRKGNRRPTLTAGRTPGSRLYFRIARLLSDHFETLSPEDQNDFLGMLDQALADLRAKRQEVKS